MEETMQMRPIEPPQYHEQDHFRQLEESSVLFPGYFPMPSTSATSLSPTTTSSRVDIDSSLNGGPSSSLSMPANSSVDDHSAPIITPLSPASAIPMAGLNLNQGSSSGQDQHGMFALYGSNRTKTGSGATAAAATSHNDNSPGIGLAAGSLSAAGSSPQMLNMNMDAIQASLSSLTTTSNNGDAPGSPTGGTVPQQIMLEQFRLAQLQQLQNLQAQIFQQQLALINSGGILGLGNAMNSNQESTPAEQSQAPNTQHQNRQAVSFHGLPTPGSSTELRAQAPPLEFVSPMLLNYVANDMNEMNQHQTQPHASYPPSSSTHDERTHSRSHHHHPQPSHQHVPHHSQSNPHSTPHSVTQTPVYGPREDEHTTAMVLDNLAPLPGRFSHEDENANFQHRGTSSAPAHIAFSQPSNQYEDFDISPLTSPWLGAEGSGGRNRVQAFSHHHHHGHSQQPEWNPSNGSKRTGSPIDEQARKTRQSPAVRATIPSDLPSNLGRRNSRSSRSVNSTPLLKGTVDSGAGVKSRRGSVVASKTTSPPQNQSNTFGEMVQDSPSPVDLSLSMPPPATPSTHPSPPNSNQNQNTADAATPSTYGMDGMNISFDVPFNFNGMGSGQQNSGRSSYNEASSSMPPPIAPVTPASIMNLGRGMSSPNGAGSSNGRGMFGSFGVNGMGTGSMARPGGMEMQMILPSPNAPQPSSSLPSSPAFGPTGETSQPSAAAPTTAAGPGKKGKGKTAKDSAVVVAAGNGGVSTRSKSARKAAAPSPNLKAILPAGAASTTNSPIIAPTNSSLSAPTSSTSSFPTTAVRKTSHKAAEQKRRDSLRTTFDDLRVLLPPIPLPSDATDDVGLGNGGFVAGVVAAARASMLPGALPPRGPPKAGGEGPNKGVSKLQLLICGNEYIRVLKGRVERRDDEIEKLRKEIRMLRLDHASEDGVDLEKDLDAVEWAHVRAQTQTHGAGEPILEEDEGEED